MRWDELGWDNYGPAHVGQVRAAADASGKLIAYEYRGLAARLEQHRNDSEQLALGKPTAEWPGGAVQGVSALNCGGMYDVPNLRLVNHKLPVAEYLKGGWLRSPLDLSFSFASEQAIDQLAYLLEHGPARIPPAQYQGSALAGVLDAVAQAAQVDSASGGFEAFRRENRHRPGIGSRNASGFLRSRRGRDRGQ